jgi:hypothetical protein
VNRGCALVLAVVGGAALAQFAYMLVGNAIFLVLMPFGLDDDLWNPDTLSTVVFIAVALASWAGSSWAIWRLLTASRPAS